MAASAASSAFKIELKGVIPTTTVKTFVYQSSKDITKHALVYITRKCLNSFKHNRTLIF